MIFTSIFQRGSHNEWLRSTLGIVIIISGFLALMGIIGLQRTTDFIIFCIYVLGYTILYGYMGRLSFGHMLYLGTGAYASTLFAVYVSENPFLALLFGILSGVLIGLILGPIIIRTTGACFALINLAFNQVGFFLALVAFPEYTGGEDGKAVSFSKVGFIDFNNRATIFIFALLCLLFVFYLLKRISSSPYGVLVKSIKEDETRVKFLGYNTTTYKLVTFIISTTITAFAGSLTILNYGYMTTGFIEPGRNVEVIFATLIGGPESLYGAIIGGVSYMLISNFLAIYIPRWEMFLGMALLLIVFRFRKGIWGFISTKYAQRFPELG
jgi:branched-chain amino acid transport system permease protein